MGRAAAAPGDRPVLPGVPCFEFGPRHPLEASLGL